MRVAQSIPLMMTMTTTTSCCAIVHLMEIEFPTLEINRWSTPRPIRNYQMENTEPQNRLPSQTGREVGVTIRRRPLSGMRDRVRASGGPVQIKDSC